MSKPPFIVAVDTSGSMAEGGRIILLRHLCRYILQRRAWDAALAAYEIRIVSWGREVKAVAPAEDGGVPLPAPGGRCKSAALTAWLQEGEKGMDAGYRLLIITDDCDGEAKAVAEAARANGIPVVCVYVGAESEGLASVAGSRCEYIAEHIGSAVRALLDGGGEYAGGLPGTVAELGETSTGDDAEDEW